MCIRDRAEGGHAAEILGTAIHSLLGLDLVDRLESDLKVLERRKRSEGLGDEAVAALAIVRNELAQVDGDQEKAANDEGSHSLSCCRVRRAYRTTLSQAERPSALSLIHI